MAPIIDTPLVKRFINNCSNGDYGEDCSGWDNWVRWVVAAVIVVLILIVAFGFSCYNSRRRRRMGMQPRYGMGWMAKPPAYGQNNGAYAYNGAPAPPYTPAMRNQQTGNTYNSNEGHYNGDVGRQNEYELQSPASAYHPQRGGDPVYEAPMGPPPDRKGDAIVR